MNTWSISFNGISTVLMLELKQRIRSKRIYIALGVWFAFVGFVTWLLSQLYDVTFSDFQRETMSRVLFATVTMFVMGMCLLVAPAFSASSIVSDREHGTLATLQATKLSAVEIASGKLIASWLVSLAFVVATVPYVAYAVWLGGVTVWQVIVVTLVVFIEVALICTIGLGWSAVASRAIVSTVLTYLSVAFMTLITMVIFFAVSVMTVKTEYVSDWELPEASKREYVAELGAWFDQHAHDNTAPPAPPWHECTLVRSPRQTEVIHTEYTWWLLLLNPFVIVADAAPTPVFRGNELAFANDPLSLIKMGVRAARIGGSVGDDSCGNSFWMSGYNIRSANDGSGTYTITREDDGLQRVTDPVTLPVSPYHSYDLDTPVWPWGMASNLLIAFLFFRLAVNRLSVPYGVLPSGRRVA